MGFIQNLMVRIGLKDDDFSKGLNRAASRTKSFTGQAGAAIGGLVAKFTSLTAAVALVGHKLAEAARTVMQFERANSTLASILGTNKRAIADMSAAAEDLGRKTEFTATQVTELQTELAKLGFSKKEILDSEESILKFAAAVGTDLASAAAFAGGTLRAFDYDASQMGDVLDVMAAACTNTALDFGKLSTALPIVASTAKAFRMEVNQVAALLGVLANKNIEATTAATSLRNIFLDAVSANSKLAAATGMTLRTYDDVFAALKKLSDEGGNLEDIAGAGTVRTATQIAALASSIPTIKELEGTFAHAGGVLEQMYATATDNAVGGTRNLASAWEGLMLTLRGADGPIQKVSQALANLLNKITDLIKSPFWHSGFWETWKKGMRGAADVITAKFSPVLNLFKGLRKFFPGKKGDDTDAGVDSYDIVFGDNDPNFIGPVLQKQTSKTITYNPSSDPLHQVIDGLGKQTDVDAWLLDDILKKRAELTAQLAGALTLGPDAWKATAGAYTGGSSLSGQDSRLREQARQAAELTAYWDNMRYAADNLTYALEDGLIGAFDELANVIAGVEDADFSTIAKALLTPLADMAVTMGTMIMTSGEAIEALKASLTYFFGGNAIVAGAALVGIGVAMKTGLAAMAKGGHSSAAGVSTSAGSSGSGSAENIEMTINIEGKLKGSDIVLAGQRTQMAWGR